MIGALLSAVLGAAGVAVQAGANSDATNLGYRNLALQERMADENLRLAKSTRADALGNKVRYVPGRGWVTETTPGTGKLLNAIQQEMIKRSTHDARLRRENLDQEAGRNTRENDAADEALAEYRYGPQKSEGTFMDDAFDTANYGYERSLADNTNAVARQAIRSGNNKLSGEVFQRQAKQRGDNLVEALFRAKSQGRDDFARQEQMRGGKLAQALQLAQAADSLQATPMGESNAVERLAGQQNQQFNDLSGAFKSKGAMEGDALKFLSDLAMKGGSSLANALAGINLSGLDGGGGTAKASTSAAPQKKMASIASVGDDYYPFAELSSAGRDYDRWLENRGAF